MKANNKKGQGKPKLNSGSTADRDGKSFEKHDIKSILKGTRGASKFSTDKPSFSDKRSSGDFTKRENNRSSYGERKPYERREGDRPYGERKPYERRDDNKPYGERKPYERRDDNKPYGERKPYERREGDKPYGERKPYERREGDKPYGERKSFERREGGTRPHFGNKPYGQKYSTQDNIDSNGEKIYGRNRDQNDDDLRGEKLTFRKKENQGKSEFVETRFDNKVNGVSFRKPIRKSDDYDPNAKYSNKKQLEFRKKEIDFSKPIRLNKFLANAGICSRREADEYIQAGVISVNGQIVTELGVKVMLSDKVMFHDQTVHSERKVYLLLNKPKDCVTTSEDTHERLTVLDLVKNACSERIYPVGRLDRNTTGVLLLTNDGDLASKLTHPKYKKKKIYHVTLDKPLEEADYNTVLAGVTLDDDTVAADALNFVKEDDLKQIGIEIHSGQNRVVRRIFEKLGYKVVRLDRVFFAGLTKKNLTRGKYRFLTDREISMLKMGAHE